MGYMNPDYSEFPNNERLRELVEESGLTQAAALAIFNIGLGTAAYSFTTWKAYLANPKSSKFRPMKDALLAHAETNFKRHMKTH